ncbi:MAG: HlyD family efflux transporter periplasmic adaptor subunit [Pirellulales bacterium]|nr:HlyD family efflux transporter periplasmic adaptor subunit [Pirellulales bacterium]
MVRLLFVVALIVFAAAKMQATAASEAPLLGLSVETAAIFNLPGATDDVAEEEAEEEEADEEADEEKDSDETKDADEESKKSDSKEDKEDAKSADEDKDAEESKDDEKSEKAEPTKAEKKQSDEKDAKESDEKPADEKKSADEKSADAKKPAEEKEKKPEIVKVKTKDLRIEVEAEGVFVAKEAEEVALRPEVWTTFKVLEAVPHGKRVRKGDVLVKFDEKDIDEAIAEKSLAQRLGELALMEAEEEFPRLEKSITLNYDQTKREYDQAKDEHERFQKTMREMSEKLAEYYLKSAEQDFDSAQEELDQLVKMYEADELTEETEEIVLRRQKFQVEAAKFFVDYSKINHEYTMNISIPRREEMLKTAVELAKIEFERAKMTKSLGMNQKRYELQALRETRARSVENHAKLEQDRALMTLKSPADGIAYYGRQVNGRWIEIGSQEQKLVPFGTVSPNSVVMTIVKDRPMYVETSIGEKELPTVNDEQEVIVAPAADSEVELKGTVEKVADVPGSGNKFVVRVELKDEKTPEWLMPGMTGKAKITTYDVKDAVAIAADLVQADADDPKQKYVMVQVEDEDKPVRRDIKLGKSKDKEVEVLKGLKKGDEIVKGAKDESAEDEEDKDDEKKE